MAGELIGGERLGHGGPRRSAFSVELVPVELDV